MICFEANWMISAWLLEATCWVCWFTIFTAGRFRSSSLGGFCLQFDWSRFSFPFTLESLLKWSAVMPLNLRWSLSASFWHGAQLPVTFNSNMQTSKLLCFQPQHYLMHPILLYKPLCIGKLEEIIVCLSCWIHRRSNKMQTLSLSHVWWGPRNVGPLLWEMLYNVNVCMQCLWIDCLKSSSNLHSNDWWRLCFLLCLIRVSSTVNNFIVFPFEEKFVFGPQAEFFLWSRMCGHDFDSFNQSFFL